MKFPSRDPNSHKGEQGKVLIVGGDHLYYGAPIFTALGAEQSGADLITLFLPEEHLETAKHYSLNLFLRPFVKGNLGLKDIGLIIEAASQNQVLIIGNGIGRDPDTVKALITILKEVKIPVVLDAEALIPEILDISEKSNWLLTPHQGEFKRLFGNEATETDVVAAAANHGLNLLVKAPMDLIASPSRIELNGTGCAQMRVGGTGDALAGIAGSFIAQGMEIFDAALSAAYLFGKCGEELAQKQNTFTTLELVRTFSKRI
ncbi:MAG: NAD(P)H-hydrate dehydratase [Rickettsiales bacterium]